MGNCQAAEAATVVVHHPGGNRVERIYWSVSATEIMNSNPGHYVAQVVAAPSSENAAPAKQLKLLRPDDTLVIGHVYRLISFEGIFGERVSYVLKEFGAKKCVNLGRLLKERRGSNSIHKSPSIKAEREEVHHLTGGGSSGGSSRSRSVGRHHGGGGQWRPALQSIEELGS